MRRIYIPIFVYLVLIKSWYVYEFHTAILNKLVLGTGIEPVSNGYQPFVLTYCTNLVK